MDMNAKVPPLVALEIILIFTLIAVASNWWFWNKVYAIPEPGTEQTESFLERDCRSSGGTVSIQSCCKSAKNFPDSCLVGACGCSQTDSHKIKVCDCGQEKCFNGKACVPR